MSDNEGWGFCAYCGKRMAFSAQACPHCGAPNHSQAGQELASPKSYGVAVALCGVFGTMGLHHFYLGNFWHGVFDFVLFAAAVYFWITGTVNDDPSALLTAILIFAVDAVHTLIVFTLLIIGKAKDGNGYVVSIPSTT